MNNFTRHRNDIDGLRAIAVFLVILYHFFPDWFGGGYIGVDIFFVISGYVVTGSLVHNQHGGMISQLNHFYMKRIKRILPSLTISIFASFIIITVLVAPDIKNLSDTGMFALLGLSNLHLRNLNNDYFADNQNINIFLHTWSLGVEEQFYLFYPLILLFLLQNKSCKDNKKLFYSVLLSLIVLSAAFSLLSTWKDRLAAFYLMPSRFWELGTGGLLYIIHWSDSIQFFGSTVSRSRKLQILALSFALAGYVVAHKERIFPFPGAVFIVCATLAFISAGLDPNARLNRWIASPVMVYFGKISYLLYLWHWPIYCVMLTFYPKAETGIKTVAILSVMLISGGLRKTERYFIALRPKRNWVVFASSAFAVLSLIGFAHYITIPLNARIWTNSYKQLPQPWWPRECHLAFFDPADVRRCLQAREKVDGMRNLYLIGDSHAGNFYNVVRHVEKKYDFILQTMTIGGRCSFKPDSMIDEETESKTNCMMYNQAIFDFISSDSIQPGDVVAVAMWRLFMYGTQRDELKRAQNQYKAIKPIENHHPFLQNHLERAAQILKNKNAFLLLISDTPLLPHHPKECILPGMNGLIWKEKICGVPLSLSMRHVKPLHDVYKSVVQQNDNVFFIDVHDTLCDAQYCDFVLRDKIIFIDKDHFSVTADESLTRELDKQLSNIYEKINQKPQ
ncbi:MAG: acyltransferase [Magnetococcus sp. YQC-5]